MKVIKYEIVKKILIVGFKEDNFVVYSQIAYDDTKTKDKLLQLAYIQVKHTIDYERTLTEHSIITNEIGEEFIPEAQKANTVKLIADKNYVQFMENQNSENVNLTVDVKDQYGDKYNVIPILTTNFGTIANNILTIPNIAEDKEIIVITNIEELSDSIKISVYPYIEPQIIDEPVDEAKETLAEAIIDFNDRLTSLEGGI